MPVHVRPRGYSGVVLLCAWYFEQYSWCQSRVNTYMTHFCIATYLSKSRLTTYSRKSLALRLFRSRSRASIIGAGSRYQERASSMRSFTTSLSDCRPVSFIRWSSQVRISSGTRTLMLDNSMVRGVRAMRVVYQTCFTNARTADVSELDGLTAHKVNVMMRTA